VNAFVSLHEVSHAYGAANGSLAVDNLSIEIAEGEFDRALERKLQTGRELHQGGLAASRSPRWMPSHARNCGA